MKKDKKCENKKKTYTVLKIDKSAEEYLKEANIYSKSKKTNLGRAIGYSIFTVLFYILSKAYSNAFEPDHNIFILITRVSLLCSSIACLVSTIVYVTSLICDTKMQSSLENMATFANMKDELKDELKDEIIEELKLELKK